SGSRRSCGARRSRSWPRSRTRAGGSSGPAKRRSTAAMDRRRWKPPKVGACRAGLRCSSNRILTMNPSVSEPRLRRIDFAGLSGSVLHEHLNRQWLVTNGLGGYASGTIGGDVTWRYHGLLIAALPAPFGRVLMLNHLAEGLRLPDGRVVQFGGLEASAAHDMSAHHLRDFRLENQLPLWRYEIDGVVIEKRILMPHRQNSVHLTYRLVGDAPDGCHLELRPSLHFRPFESAVSSPLPPSYELRAIGRRFEVHSGEGYPPLRLAVIGDQGWFIHEGGSRREIYYERDALRGYEARGELWSPGRFTTPLRTQDSVTLVASTEDWHIIEALEPEDAAATERMRSNRLLTIADPQTRRGFAPDL